MKITWDAQARAVYVYVSDAPRAAQTQCLDGTVVLDMDDGGTVLGIEILDVRTAPYVERIDTP